MNQRIIRTILLCAMFAVLPVGRTSACEILVRDAAFRAPRDVHLLCIIAEAGDQQADSIADELTAWLDEPARGLNIELERVSADDPNVEWSKYGIPSAPPSLPVVIFVGRNRGAGRSFVIDHWEPSPAVDDLALLLDSPARQQLQEQTVKSLAVLLYSPGQSDTHRATRGILDEVVSQFTTADRLGLSIVQVERDDPRERTLLSFMGIDPEGPDWVGVVFGAGKLMSPPLAGAEIQAEPIGSLIRQLRQACSCSKPLPSLGVDLPLVWNEQWDARVIPISEETDEIELASLPGGTSHVTDAADGSTTTPAADRGSAAAAGGTSLLAAVAATLGVLVLAVFAASWTVLRRGG